jgi:hypothetical protein
MMGVHSARLDLQLDAAPTVTAGVPQDLGLFDVNFGDAFDGVITGSGDLGNLFSSVDASDVYEEGAEVSAVFGNTKFKWQISYTGNITWTDADNSVVDAIAGPGAGTDVVLIGLGTETVAVDDADFDGDGDVDGADFLTWQRNLGANAGQTGGDADNSGLVDGTDLGIWKDQFGVAPITATIAAVPEPTAATLAFLALAGSLPLFRKRSS